MQIHHMRENLVENLHVQNRLVPLKNEMNGGSLVKQHSTAVACLYNHKKIQNALD